ncbi:hypothetical protein DVH24_024289, partial [Malus domestica]
LSSQRFDAFVDSESLKDSTTDSPIFHGSIPAAEAFSPPSIYAESNGQGFNGGFGGSDDLTLPPQSEMLPKEGFALREWRWQNAINVEEKEKKEKELLVQIIEQADEFKVGFYQKRKITTKNNKAANKEREKFHAEVDKNYWKAIANLIPNEVPAVEKKKMKKDTEKKPSILVHNTHPHLKPSPPTSAPTNDAKPSTSSPPKAAVVAATPEAVVAVSFSCFDWRWNSRWIVVSLKSEMTEID